MFFKGNGCGISSHGGGGVYTINCHVITNDHFLMLLVWYFTQIKVHPDHQDFFIYL